MTLSSSGVSVIWIYLQPFAVRRSYGSSWPLTGLELKKFKDGGAMQAMLMWTSTYPEMFKVSVTVTVTVRFGKSSVPGDLHPMATSKARYEAFLINNVSTISTLESSLRSITWFLPGRFKDAELASEARPYTSFRSWITFIFKHNLSVTTLLNVVSMYHDTLLSRVIRNNPSYRPLIPSTLHNRFTKAWSDKDILYKWAARSLEIIRFLELVVEMVLRRKVSERVRWRSIIVIETIKYFYNSCHFTALS